MQISGKHKEEYGRGAGGQQMSRRNAASGFAGVLLVIMLLVTGCAGFRGASGIVHAGMGKSAEADGIRPLTVSILKVGKADAIIFIEDDHAMVIDTGEEDDGTEASDFLLNRGIRKVETLIITHFDKDHVGGADTLIERMDEVGQVLVPAYTGSGTEYLDFIAALNAAGITPTALTETTAFQFGSAGVTVEPPRSYEIPVSGAEMDNNFSLITTVMHGSQRLVFTGDIEKQRIREWIDDENSEAGKCDFLKVPHHGVYNMALDDLFCTLRPGYAVICSSAKHPADTATLELLKKYGTDVLETRQGDVTVISTGDRLEIHQKVKKGTLL